MAGIDKAAIAFSIAIVAVGVGFAFYMDGIQSAGLNVSAPTVSKTMEPVMEEPKVQADPFADIANKVKEGTPMVKETKEQPKEKAVEVKDKVGMEGEQKQDTMKTAPTGPKTHTVNIPTGTSVPGCEDTNSCYSPAKITIKAGDTVKWVNADTAAHTVTGGTPADGPSGVFDSSLVMADASFSFTFDKAGSYKYFCMVHPWMVGSVTVN